MNLSPEQQDSALARLALLKDETEREIERWLRNDDTRAALVYVPRLRDIEWLMEKIING